MSAPSIKSIPPCVDRAIASAFKIQLSTEAKVTSLSMDQSILSKFDLDCMSSVSMRSSTLLGLLSIGFPEKTFFGMIEKMLGEKIDKITAENSDAASEILNIIFASARKEINESGFDFQPAIPTTVIGKDLGLSKSNMADQGLFFQCSSEIGEFLVLLALRTKTANDP